MTSLPFDVFPQVISRYGPIAPRPRPLAALADGPVADNAEPVAAQTVVACPDTHRDDLDAMGHA